MTISTKPIHRILIKFVAKCKSLQSLSSENKGNLCNPNSFKNDVECNCTEITESSRRSFRNEGVIAQLICAFVFLYTKASFFHYVAPMEIYLILVSRVAASVALRTLPL